MDENTRRREFDTGYGTVARLDDDTLTIFGKGEFGVRTEAPLREIASVTESGLPGGQSSVCIGLRSSEHGYGLTFIDPQSATAFTDAVLDAIEDLYQNNKEEQ